MKTSAKKTVPACSWCAVSLLMFFIGLTGLPGSVQARSPVIMVTTVDSSDEAITIEQRMTFSSQLRKSLLRAEQKCRVVGERRTAQILSKLDLGSQKCTSECASQVGQIRYIDFVLWGRVQQVDSGLVGELAIYSTRNGSLISSKKRERYSWDDLSSALLAAIPHLITPLERLEGGLFRQPEGEQPAEVSSRARPRVRKSRDLWEEARQKPPLFEEEASGFFGTRVSLGFSFSLPRASYIENAFTPLYHLALDFHYQIFPLIQIAVVADVAQLRGENVRSSEFVPNDCFSEDCKTRIESSFGTLWMIGVRPTLRMNLEVHFFEAFFGMGMGYLHSSTNGTWTKTAVSLGALDDSTQQQATYRFEQSEASLYSAFELAGIFRLLDRQMGIGLLFQYTQPVMVQTGQSLSVKVVRNTSSAGDGQNLLFEPEPDDYRNTLVRHRGSFGLLTIAVTVNYVF